MISGILLIKEKLSSVIRLSRFLFRYIHSIINNNTAEQIFDCISTYIYTNHP